MSIFSPLEIGTNMMDNHIGIPPMCTYLCESKEGVANDFHIAHYTTLALGQPGFIIQEATAINKHGHISENCLGIYLPRQREGLKRLVETIHQIGAKFGIQLNHAGFKNEFGTQKYGPMEFDDVLALDEQKIQEIIKDFEFSCKWARELGYDFVEVHAAHGYLINQFLSPITNQRSDAYGEDRTRLLKEVVIACMNSFEGDVYVRVSAEEYEEEGIHIEEMVELSKQLEEMGVSAIDVSTGGLNKQKIDAFPMYQVPYASAIKKAVNIPVFCVGLISKEEEVNQILTNKDADVVMIGRALLREPYLLLEWKKHMGLLSKENTPTYLYRAFAALKD